MINNYYYNRWQISKKFSYQKQDNTTERVSNSSVDNTSFKVNQGYQHSIVQLSSSM